MIRSTLPIQYVLAVLTSGAGAQGLRIASPSCREWQNLYLQPVSEFERPLT